MTTSGVQTYSPAFVDIAAEALRDCGIIDDNESPTSEQLQMCFRRCNSLIKQWQAAGIHLWTEEEALLFLRPGQARYLIGGSTTDRAVDAYRYVVTELTSAQLLGAGSIVVDDASGISDGDRIGIVLDDGTTQWTTVNGAPVGSTVTLTAALTGPASAENNVFAYPAAAVIGKPLKVPGARTLLWASMTETPMGEPMARSDYMDLPNKTNPGIPTQFFYGPKRDQGEFFVWQPSGNSNYAVRFTWYRPLEIFATSTETADVPDEWGNALHWNLAKEVGAGLGVNEGRWNRILAMAEETYDIVSNFDRESEDINLVMDFADQDWR